MVAATQSYRERLKAQRAEARAKREAEKAEWHRRAELRYEIRKLAMDAVKPRIRAPLRLGHKPRPDHCIRLR